jgi:hypothetical protein
MELTASTVADDDELSTNFGRHSIVAKKEV